MKKSEKDQIQSTTNEKHKLQVKRGVLIAVYVFIIICIIISLILLMLSGSKDQATVLIISGYGILVVSILLIITLAITKPMKKIKDKLSTHEVNELIERMREKKK